MNFARFLVCGAIAASGCSTTSQLSDPANANTTVLCRSLAASTDETYRRQVADILIRRGATVEKCQRLVSADNQIAGGIAVVAAGAAVGAAAANSAGGYQTASYGVAWDQFRNQYYQPIWRCRDKATGQFVDDFYCSGKPMIDSTWPGWSV